MQEVRWGRVESATFVIIMSTNGWTLVFSDEDNKPYVLCHNSTGHKRTHTLFERVRHGVSSVVAAVHL